ncbi:MAG: hypothetical protein WB679_07955 [Terracidiphilus sp.]
MTPQSVEQEASSEGFEGVGDEARLTRVVKRIFGRHLMDMAILVLLPLVLSGLRDREHVLGDPDIWWHLANARILCESHHFIHIEPYSFSVAGQRWVDPEWLSELPFWFGFKAFGLVGIYLVAWLGVCANVLFVYWRSYLGMRHAGVALWMSALGFVLMWVNTNARTILLAFLVMSVELGILEAAERGRPQKLWLLPPLFCLWINLHGSWLIGVGLLVLYIVCGLFRVSAGTFQQERFSSEQRNRLLVTLGASLALLFVNPYGWRLVWNPLDMVFNQSLNIANVLEWQPLNLSWNVGKAAIIVISLTILANVIHSRKWKIYELAFIFFAWYAAFDHARFTFLAAVVTIPMLAADMKRSFFPISNPKTIPLMNGLVAAGVIGVIVWYFPTNSRLQKGLVEGFPLQTIASVQPAWRTLNEEHIGGMMDFNFKPTFIDTRWDTFEHHGVFNDYLDIFRLRNPLPLLDKYRVDHALLRKDEPLSYVLERSPGWSVVRTEGQGQDRYELFVNSREAGKR